MSARWGSIWGLFRKVLFRFDAEVIHHLSFRVIRFLFFFSPRFLRQLSGSDEVRIETSGGVTHRGGGPMPQVFGLSFRSRVGLAAGFDKNGEVLEALPHLGFGFAEIGTVTPLPQVGHPRPRLFRNPAQNAIFNRMGFNNWGAVAVARRLEGARSQLPESFRVGVNIGKGRDTPLDQARLDYVQAVRPFRGLVDFVVMNVSSPNTQGLRQLQNAAALAPLVSQVREEISGWSGPVPPLLLKLAPELGQEEWAPIFAQASSWGVSGFVLTNTLGGVWTGNSQLSGGWSGGLLTELARDRLRLARTLTQLPIISVGGILSEAEAESRMHLGADLIQIYSGWIYQGPHFPARLARKIEALPPV